MSESQDVGRFYVTATTTLIEALEKLNETKQGILLLVDGEGRFLRTVTDGDLRRLLLDGFDKDGRLEALPRQASHVIAPGYTSRAALELMQQAGISHLPVVGEDGKAMGIVARTDVDQHILLSTPHMGTGELDFVTEAFRTNWIAPLGPNVDAFEREIAELVGAKKAVALNSGTAAIHLGLILLGIGEGDVVFCSSLTFAATCNPILYQRAQPVFIDSEPDSWNMSPAALAEAFRWAKANNQMPKAVIIVGLYGQSADMDPLRAICDAYGVPILEDAAEALGATYKGRAAGTLGDIGIYSFNGNKIITTAGGGMLIVKTPELADRARFLASQARDPAPYYQHSELGFNYRLSNILAGVGRGQLMVLGERVQQRRAIFDAYRQGLADVEWLEWMGEPDWSFSTRWLTACTIHPKTNHIDPVGVIRALSDEFIEARHVWKPMQMQPLYAASPYFAHEGESVSERLFRTGLCLPSGSSMTVDEVGRVIDVIRRLK